MRESATGAVSRREPPLRDEGLPEEFTKMLDELAASYLRETDPIRASGFGGGPERWRSEREPILDGIPGDGDLLDVGCANGYLLLCLVRWGRERGLRLTPHGVDRSEALVVRARELMPRFSANMHVGDAWTWTPPRRYAYVYALYDCVPVDYLAEYVQRLLDRAVANDGRLILGAYGSRSAGSRPFDVVRFLESHGHVVSGHGRGGSPPMSLFGWVDRPLEPGDRSTEGAVHRAADGADPRGRGSPW
jgi:SAM-dependent methyltransferase